MPRKLELTWIVGSDGRTGRWRKKYRGVQYYFPGTTKKDIDAYDRALDAWLKKKAELDAAAPVDPLQLEYAAAVKEWADVVAWSVANSDESILGVARAKLADLQGRAAQRNPPPLTPADRFSPQGPPPTVERFEVVPLVADAFKEGAEVGRPLTEEGIAWRDRLEVQSRKQTPKGESVAEQVKDFLDKKRLDVQLGKLTPGRFEPIRVHFEAFAAWFGGTTSIKLISPKTVEDYFTHCTRLVVEGFEVVDDDGKKSIKKLSAVYAADRFAAFRRFVRWLWEREAIESLPRNLDKQDFKIAKAMPAPETMSVAEVNKLLAGAGDRDRLYLLLMLNCGMTQKDIADLAPSEVDLDAGTITRKRSKTKQHANVPTVRYRLWAETRRLLKQFAAKAGDRVLVNRDGKPLWFEEIKNGRAKRNDNINSAYDRLRRKLGFRKPLKALRKTSASMLKSHKDYTSLDQLFLCHAPRSVADRHYSKAPQDLLDEALAWLEKQYVTATETGKKQSQGRKS